MVVCSMIVSNNELVQCRTVFNTLLYVLYYNVIKQSKLVGIWLLAQSTTLALFDYVDQVRFLVAAFLAYFVKLDLKLAPKIETRN